MADSQTLLLFDLTGDRVFRVFLESSAIVLKK
jgi:hypothetical protein